MTPIHGEADIKPDIKGMLKPERKWPKAKSQMAKVEQLMYDEARTQMAKPLQFTSKKGTETPQGIVFSFFSLFYLFQLCLFLINSFNLTYFHKI